MRCPEDHGDGDVIMKRFTETEMDVNTLLGIRSAIFDTVTARVPDIEAATAKICAWWFAPGTAKSDGVFERIAKLIESLNGDETPGRIANLCMETSWNVIAQADPKMHRRLEGEYSTTLYARPQRNQAAP